MHYKRKSISIRPISSEIMLKNLALSFLMGPTHGISVAHGTVVFQSDRMALFFFWRKKVPFFAQNLNLASHSLYSSLGTKIITLYLNHCFILYYYFSILKSSFKKIYSKECQPRETIFRICYFKG